MNKSQQCENKIKLVVFDMDDTLYAERDYVRSGYAAIAEHLAETNRIDDPETISHWMWQRFCSGETANMFDAVSEFFKLQLIKEDILILVNVYRQHKPSIMPDTEALDLLKKLKGKYKLALLSDGFLPAQQYKLDALGLADLFDTVLFTESMGREYWKPNPAGFEKIASQLNIDHKNCVYIGDNAAKDFAGPNSLGWFTIQWKRSWQVHTKAATDKKYQARLIVHSSSEIHSALS